MRRWISVTAAVGVALALGGGVVFAGPGDRANDLVVHEWGTFLAMQGGDGVTLDGMYHEEHALPGFVHARSKDQLRMPSVLLKGETPVIYFYTPRAQKVRAEVRFPSGFWTQWYPQASMVGPGLSQASSGLEPKNGKIVWNADLLPAAPGMAERLLPPTPADALWRHSREVDAAFVRTVDRRAKGGPAPQHERFLFYRGLGKAVLPLTYSQGGKSSLTAAAAGPAMRHLFLIRVEGKRAGYRYVPELRPGQRLENVSVPDGALKPLEQTVSALEYDLATRLTASGLYPKEARAMVNTWSESYFRSSGKRVLFVLPQSWTDAFIPMSLDPQPRELVRVMVGRLELLTAEREELVENAVRQLASREEAVRLRAFNVLRDQGRYAEPVLRRIARTGDQDVRDRARQLLSAAFVTELRAAVNSATDGSRTVEDPVNVRAQLAQVLKDLGLHEEARTEGAAVLEELDRRPRPRFEDDLSRHPLRARARAEEAIGDHTATVAAYEDLIRFGAQAASGSSCRGCHGMAGSGPTSAAWFRDWWAGSRYVEAVRRAGMADDSTRRLEARSDDIASKILLAYLSGGEGQGKTADARWSTILRTVQAGRK